MTTLTPETEQHTAEQPGRRSSAFGPRQLAAGLPVRSASWTPG